MATDVTLSAKPRDGARKGAVRKLRASGRVPAVIYGHGEQTREISVDALELSRLLQRVHVENTVLTLDIEGAGPVRALVREVQRQPHRPEVIHLDFYQIHAGERILVDVPVRLVGPARGVRDGGVLDQVIYDLHVRCSADQIPDHIDVDVTGVGINESVHVRDVKVPEGVEVLNDGDQTICTLVPPSVSAAAATEAAEPAATGSEPELIRKRAAAEE